MAWTRARQAVSLLGGVSDPDTRRAARLALAEVCFCLGMRDVKLPEELRASDLLAQAADGASRRAESGWPNVIENIRHFRGSHSENKAALLINVMLVARDCRAELEPWFALELTARAPGWPADIESFAVATALMADGIFRLSRRRTRSTRYPMHQSVSRVCAETSSMRWRSTGIRRLRSRS